MDFTDDEVQELSSLLHELDQVVKTYYRESIIENVAIIMAFILVVHLRFNIIISLSILCFLIYLIFRARKGESENELIKRSMCIIDRCVNIAEHKWKPGLSLILSYEYERSNLTLYKKFIFYFPDRKSWKLRWIAKQKIHNKDG